MFEDLFYKLVYIAALAIVIWAEHVVFAKPWKRNERARWVMGVATVMGLALFLVIAEMMDFQTWAWIFAAFGISGAITIGLYELEAANVNRRARETMSRAETDDSGTRLP